MIFRKQPPSGAGWYWGMFGPEDVPEPHWHPRHPNAGNISPCSDFLWGDRIEVPKVEIEKLPANNAQGTDDGDMPDDLEKIRNHLRDHDIRVGKHDVELLNVDSRLVALEKWRDETNRRLNKWIVKMDQIFDGLEELKDRIRALEDK